MNADLRRTPARVDVVILTWNDGPMLAEAISSALASEVVDVDVVVVDNGSRPPAEVPDDARVTLIRLEENSGVAPGRNRGARCGSSGLVCFLDSDARLEPDCLQRLADAVVAGPDIAMAVPVFVGQPPNASSGRAPGLLMKAARVSGLTQVYRATSDWSADQWDVDFGIGACQVFRRSAFEGVDGLDETYFYGPEDVDFCLRLREAGWRVVQVKAAACHHPARRRYRRVLSVRGANHVWAVLRHLWRHRRARSAR